MFRSKPFKSVGVCLIALVALVGCRAEEQDRPIKYEPGVFHGDNKSLGLSEEDLANLRQRSILQGGVPAGGSSAAGASGDNVRPPSN